MKILILALAMTLGACAPKSTGVNVPTTGRSVQQIAYDTIVSAKAFLDSLKSGHPECATSNAATVLCTDLAKATSAKDLLIDSLEVYCSGPGFEAGGPCQVNNANNALTKLQAAITYYNQTSGDVKAVIK